MPAVSFLALASLVLLLSFVATAFFLLLPTASFALPASQQLAVLLFAKFAVQALLALGLRVFQSELPLKRREITPICS